MRRCAAGTAVLAAATALLTLGAQPAAASVTLGATDADFAAADSNYACSLPDCGMWQATAPLGHTTIAPFDGVVVEWRMRLFAVIGSGQSVIPRLIGPVADPLPWGAQDAPIPLPSFGTPRTITQATRMPIGQGQAIAVQIPGQCVLPDQCVVFAVNGGDGAGNCGIISPAPAPGGAGNGIECATEYNLLAFAADVETDADGDGYGDETQDACATDAATQGACPPAPPTPNPDADPPALTWCGAARQPVLASGAIRGCVRSDELAAVEASAELDLGRPGARVRALGTSRSAASPGAPARFDLELNRRLLERVQGALHDDRPVRALLRIEGTDAAGNSAELTATITPKRRRGL